MLISHCMENVYRKKKILKPDVPPRRDTGALDRHGLFIVAVGVCGIVSVIAIILMVI